MKRRLAIQQLAILATGAVLLPSCNSADQSAIPLKNFSITGNQQQMLAALCETILPKTNGFVGATDLKAHEFVLKMMDDCQPPETQQAFVKGMKTFDELCKQKQGNVFVKCSPLQRNNFLKEMEALPNTDTNEALQFYQGTKAYTLQCFTGCKPYMVDVRHYKMVPGSNFKGCVAL